MSRPRHAALLVPALLAATGLLAGCGGSSAQSGVTPARALAAAKSQLDRASSWRVSLSTDARPRRGDAVLAAEGVGTHSPRAWKGSVRVLFSGISADVPVVSVGGKVHAKVPLTTGYAVIDPRDYHVPDPADFMDRRQGLSSLLTRIRSPRATGEARAGGEIVKEYAGSLPGSVVRRVVPSASARASYPTTVGIGAGDRVSSVSITGPFFDGGGRAGYQLRVSGYGNPVTIRAPRS